MAEFDTDEKCEAWIREHGIEAFRRNATARLGFGGARRVEAEAYLKRLDARNALERQDRQNAIATNQTRLGRRTLWWTVAGVIAATVIGIATLAATKGWL